jgi:hypothetical protein
MYTQGAGPFGPAMLRRQYELHAKKPNKRTMNVPTTTADPPKRDYISSGSPDVIFF